jgi:hypothetical protein
VDRTFGVELQRVIDRLRTMPLTKLQASADEARRTAQHLLTLTPDAHRVLPRIADHACGDQLAVIGQDFQRTQKDEAAIAEATAALVELRRALP